MVELRREKQEVSGFFGCPCSVVIAYGEGVGGRSNWGGTKKGEIVSKWCLYCSCLIFSRRNQSDLNCKGEIVTYALFPPSPSIIKKCLQTVSNKPQDKQLLLLKITYF